MLGPTESELAEAARLGVDGQGLSGPELRQAIERAQKQECAKLAALREYNIWVAMCAQLGIEVPSGRNAPKLVVLKQQFFERLPVALTERGIVAGARITIPEGIRLARSGRATVGKLWSRNQQDRMNVTLTFDGQKAHTFDARLVYLNAVDIMPPRQAK